MVEPQWLPVLRTALQQEKEAPKHQKLRATLVQFIPAPAVDYALAWMLAYPFHLTITKGRESKYGDYRYKPKEAPQHFISVNADLPEQAFLLTYLHEVAHMMVVRLIKKRVTAHGIEWKQTFSQILQPMLRPEVFDEQVLPAMRIYAANPKASSASDPALMKALHFPDGYASGHAPDVKPLQDYAPMPGFSFWLNNRRFEVVERKRTNYLCKDPATGRQYMVKAMAPVKAA